VILKIVWTLCLTATLRSNAALLVSDQHEPRWQEIFIHRKREENFMNDTARTTLVFLTGLGIGAGLAMLLAPKSGEETREWIADTAERKFKVLRRKGGRSIKQLQGALSKGEESLAEVLRSGKDALESVAAKLG
jgi:gas vesicle protein